MTGVERKKKKESERQAEMQFENEMFFLDKHSHWHDIVCEINSIVFSHQNSDRFANNERSRHTQRIFPSNKHNGIKFLEVINSKVYNTLYKIRKEEAQKNNCIWFTKDNRTNRNLSTPGDNYQLIVKKKIISNTFLCSFVISLF